MVTAHEERWERGTEKARERKSRRCYICDSGARRGLRADEHQRDPESGHDKELVPSVGYQK